MTNVPSAPDTNHVLLEVQMNDGTHAMTPHELVDALVYANYKHNRQRNPAIAPAEWGTVFGYRVTYFEAKFQAETGGNHDD